MRMENELLNMSFGFVDKDEWESYIEIVSLFKIS